MKTIIAECTGKTIFYIARLGTARRKVRITR